MVLPMRSMEAQCSGSNAMAQTNRAKRGKSCNEKGEAMRDTIDMAREAGIDLYGLGANHERFVGVIKAFEALVRADERNRTWTQEHWTEYERSIAEAEREACAKVADLAEPYQAADLIRARGNT